MTNEQRNQLIESRLDFQQGVATVYDIDWRTVESYDLTTRCTPLTPRQIFDQLPSAEHISLAGVCIDRP